MNKTKEKITKLEMMCGCCGKQAERLYFPTEKGRVCTTCLLEIMAKEGRKTIDAEKYKF